MGAHFSADEHFRRGEHALAGGDSAAALGHFEVSSRLEPANARYRSYLGLSLGLAERRFDKALELCRAAAKEEFFNPILYHNLARLHLAFGFKVEGIRYLRRGLMIDPHNVLILEEMQRLGSRRRPLIAFLRRGHVINRWLGRVLRRLGWEIADPDPEPARSA
jgi:tetratricopeptide (TPR) repeat protein